MKFERVGVALPQLDATAHFFCCFVVRRKNKIKIMSATIQISEDRMEDHSLIAEEDRVKSRQFDLDGIEEIELVDSAPSRVIPQGHYTLLTSQGVTNLRHYKYAGVDNSLYYEHFASPLAKWVTEAFVPLWVAPNLITVIGFVIALVSHFVLASYTPTLTEDYPSCVALLCAITTFLYQTLDNMDGKQARRTGTSSPLGQLFDHGCDSIVLTVFSINIAALMHLQGVKFAVLFTLNMTAFYVTHWEEFHTHKFMLPIVNGPNEGILTIMLLCLAAAAFGSSSLHSSFVDLLFVVFMGAAVVTIYQHISRTLVTTASNPRDFDQHAPRAKALARLLPVILIDFYVFCMSESRFIFFFLNLPIPAAKLITSFVD
jgi:phosphatidylglycerophosphate synthase